MRKAALAILMLASMLIACGETPRPTPLAFEKPIAPPTPASYDNIPGAATIGGANRPTLPRPTGPETSASPGRNLEPLPTELSEPSEQEPGVAGPGERVLIDIDPTALAKLYDTPGSNFRPGGVQIPLTPGTRRTSPSRAAPTPTLSTNPNAVRIESLRTTQVSFLAAYRLASLKLLEVSRTARPVFASANLLKPERTVWSFMFITPEGSRMWRIIYDTEGNRLDLREIAPSMLSDAALIDMSKVLESQALLERAASNGLRVNLPVDIITFQVEGLSKQPCFLFTNIAQGKQVAIHAYTGQVLRNDFS